jgi:hypothetical protein
MKRLVYYSISLDDRVDQSTLLWQLVASIHSLRRFNSRIPIAVFVYGTIPETLVRSLCNLKVSLRPQGSYERRVASLIERGSEIIAQYPILHKFLNLSDVSRDLEQVLVLDCDTIFFDDVERLFEEYAGLDCCAREEPFSKRSHQGYNRSYLDEELYHEIATHEGVAVLDPFNCGVVLLSGRVAAAFVELHPIFVDYAWRFTVWMALNPVAPTVAGNFPEGRGIDHLRRRFRSLTRAVDIQRLLPFPSSNRWILEEVAFWFTLGHIHGVRYADFSMRHALQGGEVGVDVHERRRCIVSHYFSRNLTRFAPLIEGAAWDKSRSKAASLR